jgi:hypothetical protein
LSNATVVEFSGPTAIRNDRLHDTGDSNRVEALARGT